MTDKKSIRSFTLEELLARSDRNYDAVYYDGCLIGHTAPHEGAELLRYPIRINAHIICLCRNAGGEMVSNLSRFDMKQNTLVAIPPERVICIDDSELEHTEHPVTVFAFTPEFLEKINLDVKQVMPLIGMLKDSSSVELAEYEMTALERAMDAVRGAIVYFRNSKFYHEIVRRIIESAIYMIIDVVSRRIARGEAQTTSPKSRNEEYFGRFIKCLYENYKSERSVAYYAAQLHITPKYLTTVIKSVSGRSAAEWIDEYVILEAKNLLRYSSMSVQEVAYALNFSNQSFFGKYFKQHTSMSPTKYKMQK